MVAVLENVWVLLALFLLPCIQATRKDIVIKSAGLLPIEPLDVGFSIYVTILNIGGSPVHVVSKMIECCEALSDDETDCSFMHLMGGNMGFVPSNSTRNVTLVFPNMYPYNRRGDCLIAVWYRNKFNLTAEVRASVAFDTYRRQTIDSAKERHLLSRTCISPDLDPLDNCRPVDCHQKYNGEKPYFSRIRNKCIASPACYADPNKNMPDVLNMNLRCHHGKMNNQSGLCHCDEGWTSPPISDNMMISSTLLFHMCTIKKSTIRLFNFGYFANKFFEHGSKILLTAIGLNLIALILISICFPSLDANYAISSSSDDEDYDAGKSFDSICSCLSGSEATDTTVATYYFMLDDVERELYMRGVNNAVYREVLEATICEFNSVKGNMDEGILGRTGEVNMSASSSSCSDFIIESGRASGLDGNNIDTDNILASSSESDWDPGDFANTDLSFTEQRNILKEYINDNKNYITNPVVPSVPDLRSPTIQGSSNPFDVEEVRAYSDNIGTASQRCDQLSRELESILNSSRSPSFGVNSKQLYRK
ncbi:uncharacterized protein isoform X2 [Rhodnius prolixus]|uniref:uncharacterized protein isoform X2 n=1 Tax=Rhodnius prolixus TaxID=13249 RepID=UPI003D189C6A